MKPSERWDQARAAMQGAACAYAMALETLGDATARDLAVREHFDAVASAELALDEAALEFAAATARRFLAEQRASRTKR